MSWPLTFLPCRHPRSTARRSRWTHPPYQGVDPGPASCLAGALVVIALIVASGFLFDLPYGFGGWELLLMATPIVLVIVTLGVVLRLSGPPLTPPGPPASATPDPRPPGLSPPGTRRSPR